METKYVHIFVWLLVTTAIFSVTRADFDPFDPCEAPLRAVMKKQMLGKVGVELMKDDDNYGSGFVYSEMKIFQHLTALIPLGSNSAKRSIKNFIELTDQRCITAWETMDEIIEEMHHDSEDFGFVSSIFYQTGRPFNRKRGMLTEEIALNFHSSSVLSTLCDSLSEYRLHSVCLKRNFKSETNFAVIGGLKLEPTVFGATRYFSNYQKFTDIDNGVNSVSWVKMEGEVWAGLKSCSTGGPTSISRSVKLYRTEMKSNESPLVVLYFKPEFTRTDDKAAKSGCFQDIFNNLKDFIKVTLAKTTTGGKAKTHGSIALPRIELSTDIDLKPILGKDLSDLFFEGEMTGVYGGADTLQELRIWDHVDNVPETFKSEGANWNGNADVFVTSPFVFVVVEKDKHIVFQTGAYLKK